MGRLLQDVGGRIHTANTFRSMYENTGRMEKTGRKGNDQEVIEMTRREIKSLSPREETILKEFAFNHASVDEIALWCYTTPDEILQTLDEIVTKIKAEIDSIGEEK